MNKAAQALGHPTLPNPLPPDQLKQMKNIKVQILVEEISSYQALLVAGSPSWEKDRDTRCIQKIQIATDELVRILVSEHRIHLAKLCELND